MSCCNASPSLNNEIRVLIIFLTIQVLFVHKVQVSTSLLFRMMWTTFDRNVFIKSRVLVTRYKPGITTLNFCCGNTIYGYYRKGYYMHLSCWKYNSPGILKSKSTVTYILLSCVCTYTSNAGCYSPELVMFLLVHRVSHKYRYNRSTELHVLHKKVVHPFKVPLCVPWFKYDIVDAYLSSWKQYNIYNKTQNMGYAYSRCTRGNHSGHFWYIDDMYVTHQRFWMFVVNVMSCTFNWKGMRIPAHYL